MRVALLVGVLGVACSSDPAIPWLHGLRDPVVSSDASEAIARRMTAWSSTQAGCATGDRAFEITADVAPRAGRETVLGSYAQGLVILDSEGRLLASTPGYPCDAVAELDAIAAGDAFGARTIAIVGTTGPRGDSSTWIGLFRVGADHRVDATFTGVVEERAGSTVRTGAIYLLPDALIYERPGHEPVFMHYDPVGRAYLVPGDQLDDPDHDGPSVVTN